MKSFLIAIVILGTVLSINFIMQDKANSKLSTLREEYQTKRKKKADHSNFAELKRKFNSPQEITAACIECHVQNVAEFMESAHWNWHSTNFIPGKGIVKMGKKNVINNFCGGISGNEKSCNSCHAGYGWADANFDFNNEENVDCLSCHDNSGEYKKEQNKSGNPVMTLDFNKIAQSVGPPTKKNCGSCHFFGGGGNNVKHGDLEKSLLACDNEVDVHMAQNGLNMECIDCHKTEHHKITGKMASVSAMDVDRVNCDQCHSTTPHKSEMINEHSDKVACQTCHIPTYAKVNATKMWWDWSKVYKVMDAHYEEKDKNDNAYYLAKKGEFKWQKNVKPEYFWYNGKSEHMMLGDKIDNPKDVQINKLLGNYSDDASKIYPVKVHRGKQFYDPVNKLLIQPKLFDTAEGMGALWVDYKLYKTPEELIQKSAEVGMKGVGLPFSGKVDYATTEMYWPVNHMVSKKEKALKCEDCHDQENSRMAGLTGFYMPGRDKNNFLDWIGTFAIIGTILGIFGHGFLRFTSSRKRG